MLSADPLWYKDAIIYEVHVRAFYDSDGDGLGDFRGLTQKLDYLEDLGVNAVWLLPFYPSPLKDDGYDIADYTSVNPSYGTLDDFKEFLDQAHRRDIRVITELVINHTSDQHPWFQRARRAPIGSSERDFYVWSDSPEKYPNVPLMFPDFETSNWAWDPLAKQYYWHRFYTHQPDLNFDHPAVWEAIFPVMDFWLDLGVDGMRLDAVPYLYEREGTTCEHLPETHAFLKALRKHVDDKFPNRMFLAEANAWPEDAVAYFGSGDECHMAFHFPLMPRLFMSVQQEDSFPIQDIFTQTPEIPDSCQWCLFLRNHDELTLAMVTDEERDYMYRAFARDRQARIFLGIRHRLGPLLQNDRRRIELLTALVFSLPGTPVLYYGDEIGMGDNIYLGDRNGVRTPMQWSSDRNAGFSRANPQRLYFPVIVDAEYHYEAINVEAQQNNPSSLLWWTKRMIALRKRFPAFGRGKIEFLRSDNPKTLAFVRRWEGESVLVVANLSRFVQHVRLDLKEFEGALPVELFGGSHFPRISEDRYSLSLSPYGFYWFSLTRQNEKIISESEPQLPELRVFMDWSELIEGPGKDELESLLPGFFERSLQSISHDELRSCKIVRSLKFTTPKRTVRVITIRLEYQESLPEMVMLPLVLISEEESLNLLSPLREVAVAKVAGSENGMLCDAAATPDYLTAVLQVITEGRTLKVEAGDLVGVPLRDLTELRNSNLFESLPVVHRSGEDDVSATFGTHCVLKTYRRVEEGINPDVEIGRFLERHQFTGMVPVLGTIEVRRRGGSSSTIAALRSFVPHQGTAWQHLLDQLSQFFERAATMSSETTQALTTEGPLMPLSEEVSVQEHELFSHCLETADRLGHKTGELHRTLFSDRSEPAFAPEPFTKGYQRSIYQTMRNQVAQVSAHITRDKQKLSERLQAGADQFLASQTALFQRFQKGLDFPLDGWRIRCHGDYHLGQFLYTGNDYLILDFEGDSSKPISDRRIKRSPLRDVASMIRSFDYAIRSMLYGLGNQRGRPSGVLRDEDRGALAKWGSACYTRMARRFVSSYLEVVESTGLLPTNLDARRTILELFLLEKSLIELNYDLIRRPDWMVIPLEAILRMLGCIGDKEMRCF